MLYIVVYTAKPLMPDLNPDEEGQFENVFEIRVEENVNLVANTAGRRAYAVDVTEHCILPILEHFKLPEDLNLIVPHFYEADEQQYLNFLQQGLQNKVFDHQTVQMGLQIMANLFDYMLSPETKERSMALLSKRPVTAYTLLVQSLLYASKAVMDDAPYANSSWAYIAGLPLSEVNAREIDFLEFIGLWKHSPTEVMMNQSTSAPLQLSLPPVIRRRAIVPLVEQINNIMNKTHNTSSSSSSSSGAENHSRTGSKRKLENPDSPKGRGPTHS